MFCLFEPLFDRLHGVLREGRLADDVMMEMISKKISTDLSSMSIVNGKIGTLGPWDIVLKRVFNIKNDRDAVLIVRPNNSLVGISGVGFNNSDLLVGLFGIIWTDY